MPSRRTGTGLPPTTPPERQVESPSFDSFMYQMMMDVKKSQGAIEQSLTSLTSAVDKQGQQMGKIDDIRVEVGRMSTMLEQLGTDMTSTKGKLDKVRLWIAGAAAIVALIVIIVVPLAIRYLPSSSVAANSTTQTGRGAATR